MTVPWRGRSAPAIAFLAASALALTGCIPTPSDGPVAFAPKSDAYADALLTGTLHITGECVTIGEAADAVIPVFPVGEAWFSDGVLTFGNAYRDGDEIVVGGGELPVDDPDPAGWYVPAGCPDLPLWETGPYLRPS